MRLFSLAASSTATFLTASTGRYHRGCCSTTRRCRGSRVCSRVVGGGSNCNAAVTPTTRTTTTTKLSSSSASQQEETVMISDADNNLPAQYKTLMEWLTTAKGGTIDTRVKLGPSRRGGGYGAFVTESVSANEVLLTIPRAACLTLEDAVQDSDCGSTFQALMNRAGPGGNTVVMAGYMAMERLKSLHDSGSTNNNSNNDDDDDDSSDRDSDSDEVTLTGFGPYLATLPWERGMNNQEHVLYWSDDDVETYLKGSLCYEEAKAIRDEVNLAVKVLSGIIGPSIRRYRGEVTATDDGAFRWPWQKQVEDDAAASPVEGLESAIRGAFVALLTRSFQDGDNDNDNDNDGEKLVPLLDMLQHSDDPNVSHVMRQSGDGAVEVRARGEELLNQYRSELEETMPYHRFFTRFGFVPGIPDDVIPLLEDKSSIFFAQKKTV